VLYNVDYFRERLLALIDASKTPVEWVVLDAGSINFVDSTAIDAVDRRRDELAARGIVLASASIKRSLGRRFRGEWVGARRALESREGLPDPEIGSARIRATGCIARVRGCRVGDSDLMHANRHADTADNPMGATTTF
jgi:MFS superfamily sulfate permease-like transporter